MKWVLEQSIKSLVWDMMTLRCLVDIKGEMVRRQMDTGLEFGESLVWRYTFGNHYK